ncbi:MAG: pyridoxamine 5'-phosphate oxidase family protein [Cytophagia bacterium]|nr:pyridoxamine 5'-phosphate oxidase family protein [Cytophagia bacterium]
MSEFNKNPLNKVVRGSRRAQYDKQLIYNILDSHFICQIPYVFEGTPIVIPTAYGRKGDSILIHGSLKNRMMLSLLDCEKVSLNVTHLDGLVLARSVFHHSVNYRSVNVFGKARLIEDDAAKMEALEIITENIIPGRWNEARIPNQKELDATLVIAIEIEDASAKVREFEAADETPDFNLDVWAGVLELEVHPGRLVANSDCKPGLPEPESAKNFRFSNNPVKQQ